MMFKEFKEFSKVKINVEKIIKERNNNLSKKYIKFITSNKDVIFTLRRKKGYENTSIWTFYENDTWLFTETDLILIES